MIRLQTLGEITVAGGLGADTIILPENREDSLENAIVRVNLQKIGDEFKADSYWSQAGGTWDVIFNFSAGDALDLLFAGMVLEPDVIDGDAIPEADLASLIALIAQHVGGASVTAAFTFEDSTYIFQNLDDSAEISDTDIFIQLSGVSLQSLDGATT